MTEWKCLTEVGDEFKVFNTSTNFTGAIAVCASDNAVLARISSIEEYLFVFQLVFGKEPGDFWIGTVNWLS